MHTLPAQVKLVALLVFVLAVVAMPREAFWAHGLAASLLIGVMVLAELPPGLVVRRMTVALPFVAFAILLPFLGGGETVGMLGVDLSVEGLWGAWTVLAKATLGVGASVIVSATSTVPDLIGGLDRVGVPRVIGAITGFMVRYVDIVAGEFARRRIAMTARGFAPRWFWQAGPMAQSAGSLFIRSFERGERVHQAMLARGYTGRMPAMGRPAPTARQWLAGLSVPAVVVVLTLLSLTFLR